MATLTFSGLPSGVVKTSMDGETYTEATSPITLVDGMYIFVSGYYQLIGQPATYLTNVCVDNKDSDIWSTSSSNPYILTYGGELSYTSSSTSTENINYYAKYVEIPKTTLDLSTLPDISDGTHTVTVKAKADGYRDSEASNAVNYTVTTPSLTNYILFEGETSDFTLKATKKEWNGTVEYSTDKNTWNTWDGSEISSANKKLYLRGKNNTKFFTTYGVQFVLSAKAGCYGNINTLLDYENPPTTLTERYCYYSMFKGCTSLTTAPELPATTLSDGCYDSMFKGCTSLTTAPELPATTLSDGCYWRMFSDCTSLTSAPELPATTIASSCYRGMFLGCTSLKISATQTGVYTTAWRIPSTGEIAAEEILWNDDMLVNTGGTFKGNPSINTTYYIAG